MSREAKQYDVVVEDVHSGDDLVLLVDLGVDGLHKRVRARLKGVDTPSAFRASTNSEASGVRQFVADLTSGAHCHITLHGHGRGGWMVTLYTRASDHDNVNVNDLLTARGYVYSGRRDQ